jgi:hypothetical protein
MQSERTFHNAPINQHSFRRSQNSASAFAFVLILLLAYLYAIAYDGIFFYFFILFGIIVLSSAMIDIELGLCFVPVVLANPIALVETGTNLILSEYVLLIVMGAYFVQSWTQGAVYKYSRSLLYPSLAMIFAAIFSLSNATFIVAGLQQIVRYFEVMIVLFFLIVNVCTTIRSIRRMVLSFICGGLIAAVVGIAQFITESISSGRSERVYGMLGGGYGAVMSVTVLLCIAILIYGDERWGKLSQ